MKKRINNTLLIIISLFTLFTNSIIVKAEIVSGSCGDNVSFIIDTDTGELIISGAGEMSNYSYDSLYPWYNYKSYIKSVIIEDGVTNIGDYAFFQYNITSVQIANSVAKIGVDTFAVCSDLTTVVIPSSVKSIGNYAFKLCSSLTSLTITNGVETIGFDAFDLCSSLVSLTIPDSVKSIGHLAFDNCNSLISITVGSNNPVYDSRENCNAIIETSTNTLVQGCKNTVIPSSIIDIGQCAFAHCQNLLTIKIPNSVINIEDGAFEKCNNLLFVEIPPSVKNIGKTAFYECNSTSLFIPTSIETVGKDAFRDIFALFVYCDNKKVNRNNTYGAKNVVINHYVDDGEITEANCTDYGVTIGTCKTCGKANAESYSPYNLDNHLWKTPVYEWDTNNSNVIATIECERNASHFYTESVNSIVQHIKEPTCEDDGLYNYSTHFENPIFEDQTKSVVIPLLNHNYQAIQWNWSGYDSAIGYFVCQNDNSHTRTESAMITNETVVPTCEDKGYVKYTAIVNINNNTYKDTKTEVFGALGHDWGIWFYDGDQNRTHSRICNNDSSHIETEKCIFSSAITNGHSTTYTCEVCGGKYTEKARKQPITINGITRIAGSNRFETSQTIATTFRKNYGRSTVANVILANGDNFADALAGSYLSTVKDAPIIITRKGKESEVNNYIKTILRSDGIIYVLGGTSAIPEGCLIGLESYDIKRLGGSNRYETNIIILKEAGIDSDIILIATGKNYADSLSASSTGLPMLLVKDSLDSNQKRFLSDNHGKKLIILGGTNAVNNTIAGQLGEYGSVKRLAGNSRYETSVKIAEQFYINPDSVVLAYSNDFPDGLCGGPLAYQIGAPLLLTKPGSETAAREYVTSNEIMNGYVLGGSRRLTDSCVNIVFGYTDPSPTPSPGHQYTYIGNRNSMKCHRDTCPVLKRMNESNKVYFSTIEEAIRRGYHPCHDCNPWYE